MLNCVVFKSTTHWVMFKNMAEHIFIYKVFINIFVNVYFQSEIDDLVRGWTMLKDNKL